MIDHSFRKHLPKLTQPLIGLYSRLGLTPNHVTWLGFLVGLYSAFLVSQERFIWGGVIWWLGRLFDGTDGIYARHIKRTSLFGSHLDILLDMAAYGAMIIAFSTVFPSLNLLWISIVFLYVLCITGALSLGALLNEANIENKDNRGLRLASGLAEGGETGIAYTLFLLFPSNIEALAKVWIGVLIVTVISRLLLAKKILKDYK